MLIREGDDFVEISYRTAIPHEVPGAEDAQLHIAVSSSTFHGETDVWLGEAEIRSFLELAEEFEVQRQGVVELESMSPDVFRLRIFSVDRKGHLALSGRLGCKRHGTTGQWFANAVEFGFEFDPSQLVPFLRDLRRMLEGPS